MVRMGPGRSMQLSNTGLRAGAIGREGVSSMMGGINRGLAGIR